MNNETQIKEWVENGTITQEQANIMLSDVKKKSTEEKSNKFIIAISTIGAILLGIGAILFVAANWQDLSDLIKIIILTGSTFGTYYLGYLFKYDKKNLPIVGSILFFLGALLFGASIFLIAQMYNINANNHTLVLIWLIGVLPLVYAFESEPIAALSAILFYTWIGLFIFRNGEPSQHVFHSLPIIYLSGGALLFGIGSLHYFIPIMDKIGKIFRLAGLEISMFSLFLLTFEFFSKPLINYYGSYYNMISENTLNQLTIGIILFSTLAIISILINLYYNPYKSKTNSFENYIALGLIIFTYIFFLYPTEGIFYTLIYNLIFGLLTIFLIYIGYQKSDIKIVNVGIFWLSIFIFAKYFDFFWSLMDRSLFFIVGGIILVLGGIALERKRKQIKESFIKNN